MSFDVLPFIETKRDGGEHAPGEMKAFVEALQTGKVKDYQVSAWLMAAFLRGLSSEERQEGIYFADDLAQVKEIVERT